MISVMVLYRCYFGVEFSFSSSTSLSLLLDSTPIFQLILTHLLKQLDHYFLQASYSTLPPCQVICRLELIHVCLCKYLVTYQLSCY